MPLCPRDSPYPPYPNRPEREDCENPRRRRLLRMCVQTPEVVILFGSERSSFERSGMVSGGREIIPE
jgi:hypothetical protein